MNIGDKVQFVDGANFFYNDYYDLNKTEQMTLGVTYEVINIYLVYDEPSQYELKNLKNGATVGVLVEGWEIEEVEQ